MVLLVLIMLLPPPQLLFCDYSQWKQLNRELFVNGCRRIRSRILTKGLLSDDEDDDEEDWILLRF